MSTLSKTLRQLAMSGKSFKEKLSEALKTQDPEFVTAFLQYELHLIKSISPGT